MGRFGWVLAVVLAGAATQAAAQWEYEYYPAQEGDDLAVCTAGVYYDDGPFILRVYDRTVDFYLADDGLSLPPGQALGTVVFSFRDIDFVLEADSGEDLGGPPVGHMYLTPAEGDVAPLLDRLRGRREMDIVFPDGLYYTIGLDGSSAALTEAFECWTRELTGPAEGGGANPFAAGRNPFD
jgi:hypothetical protein